MPAKHSEDWKEQRQRVKRDLPPVDPEIVNKKPLSRYEQSIQHLPYDRLKPLQGMGVVLHRGSAPGAETDPGWDVQQGDPIDYLLRLMNAAGKDTKNKRSHRPLTETRGKRTKSYRERLHGIFGNEEP